jgi:hypothetical protein
MALDFPSTPNDGDTYTSGGYSWKYYSALTAWKLNTTGYTGSAGATGYTGSAGAGYTGSAGGPGYTGSVGYTGSTGLVTGLQTIWVPAQSILPRVTNGPSLGTTESTTNKVTLRTLDFDTTTQEYAQFTIRMPKSWDESTVQFEPIWTAASGSGTVAWSLAGVALSNDDAIDTAFGTIQTSTDTLITALDIHVGPQPGTPVTIAGTPAVGDICMFQISREVGSDTLGVDAKLIGIAMFMTINAGDDT